MKYLLITIFLLTLGTSNSAQEFGNSNLRLGLFQNQNVRCYVKADTEQLSGFLNRNGGIYFSTFRGWSKIELKGQQLIHLSQLEWCSSIRIEGGKGQILSDTSLINTRTDRVHQGAIQRHPSYTGSGVVMGFVDTGIDFTHPDFKNKDGSTRIVKIWDQTKNADSTLRPSFGYGEVYDSAMINAGNCPHIDNNGHGTQVCGMGAGNGNSVPDSIADYTGHAPNSTIICVNTDFNRANWTLSIAESIEWIFSEADKLGLPCVVNLSVGTYSGSHDGKDLAAQVIDSMVAAKPGRFVVGAAGNAGSIGPFHLRTEVVSDTAFTYFKSNTNSNFGNAIFIEAWGDTAAMKNLKIGFGYTDTTLWSDSIFYLEPTANRLDTLMTTSLGGNSQLLTFSEVQGGVVLYQVLCTNPQPQHFYGLFTVGSGTHDIWSTSLLGWSDIVRTGLPTIGQYPNISKYIYPDTNQSIVSSWNCSPNIISVGNYENRKSYVNQFDSLVIYAAAVVGQKGGTSSRGPNRLNYTKPDLMAPGNYTMGAGRFQDLNYLKTNATKGYKLAKGGYHFGNGGTSMASPAVAGIAALYFEKCPTATSEEVRKALINNTFSDSYTGVVPNNVFGSGKVDAFATLSSSNLNDSLLVSGKTVICKGDSIKVLLSSVYPTYKWNDGISSLDRYVNNSDTLYMTFSNNSGCIGKSDTLVTGGVEIPVVSVISETDSFCVGGELVVKGSGAATYLWSNKENGDSIIVDEAGVFYLTGKDSNNCVGYDSIALTQYRCNVGIDDNENLPFTIFPNPVNNYLTIEGFNKESVGVDLTIMNADGKIVLKRKLESGVSLEIIQVDVSHFQSGWYILELNYKTASNKYRFVKY